MRSYLQDDEPTRDDRPRDAHVGLNGSLSELPLTDLIEMISLGRKSGRLTLYDESAAVRGRLAFHDGLLVGAESGELGAQKAFYALLGLKEGAFDFDPGAHLDDESWSLPTESLLMEGMRRLDELRRLRRKYPAPARARLLGGDAEDELEARVLGYLGPGARLVGDLVEGMLIGGEADEYDALKSLQRLDVRGVVRVEKHDAVAEDEAHGSPQPELER